MEHQDYILRESRVIYRKFKKVKSLTFKSPGIVYDWFKQLKNEVYEKLFAIYLNSANEVISFSCESVGDVDQAVIYPRKVAKNSLLNNATRVVVCHNHPSGISKPSEHDIEITKKLKSALETIDIELLDHIVIGDSNYYSFREHGLV